MEKIFTIIIFIGIALSVLAESLSGKKLYQQNCMVCHADDGSGAMSDLSERKRLFSVSESQLVERIKKGIQVNSSPISMSPKGGNPDLADGELLKILKYLKNIVQRVNLL